MMKHLLRKTLVICLMASSWLYVNAQNPTEDIIEMGDTLVIQPTYDGSIMNALNKWILWDHDGDYANAPKHKVYKLLRGNQYIIQTTTEIPGRLALVADKPDLDNPPPQIIPMNDGETGFPWRMFAGGPFTMKNIHFTAMNPSTGTNQSWQVYMQLKTNGERTIIDGCYFEYLNAHLLQVKNDGNKIYMTNNFYSNGGHSEPHVWHGNFYNSEAFMQDTLVIKNNTYINTPGNLVNIRQQMTRYVEISNNTLINTGGHLFFTTFWTETVIKNNLFYNVFGRGENDAERASQEPDGLAFSIINVDTLAGEFEMKDTTWYEKESERRIEVKNNYYGWDDEIEAIWEGRDTVYAPQWMNSRTIAMFADDVNYPLFIEENNETKASLGIPTFETPIPTTPDFIRWLDEGCWGNPQDATIRFAWEADGADIPNIDLNWPPLEDLRLTSSAFVGDDGLPLGDQNWYADRAVRWDMTGWGRDPVGISESYINNSTLKLQGYPNPFTNETRIELSLDRVENVSLSVYDITGRRVATLMAGQKGAGSHSVIWNGTDSAGDELPGGMYLLRLETDSQLATSRMIKQK